MFASENCDYAQQLNRVLCTVECRLHCRPQDWKVVALGSGWSGALPQDRKVVALGSCRSGALPQDWKVVALGSGQSGALPQDLKVVTLVTGPSSWCRTLLQDWKDVALCVYLPGKIFWPLQGLAVVALGAGPSIWCWVLQKSSMGADGCFCLHVLEDDVGPLWQD